MDLYHFLWNFTCHLVNKAYAKNVQNIFLLHMHLKNYRAKAEVTFTPIVEKKSTWQKTRHATHCGWICREDAKHCGWICGKDAKHCGRMFEARFRFADYNFAQSLQAPSLRQQ